MAVSHVWPEAVLVQNLLLALAQDKNNHAPCGSRIRGRASLILLSFYRASGWLWKENTERKKKSFYLFVLLMMVTMAGTRNKQPRMTSHCDVQGMNTEHCTFLALYYSLITACHCQQTVFPLRNRNRTYCVLYRLERCCENWGDGKEKTSPKLVIYDEFSLVWTVDLCNKE